MLKLNRQISTRWLYVILLTLSVLVLVLDQVTKFWMSAYLTWGQPYRVWSWLNFTLEYNSGAAFSMLDRASGWQVYTLALLAVVVCIGLFIWLLRHPGHTLLQVIAVSLLISGALGNLIDRLRFSHVIDFIDVHISSWHYATFNIADSAITLGVGLLILSLLCNKKGII